MVVIAAGRFDMGRPDAEDGYPDELPQHRVSVVRPFALGRCEVTVGEFRRFVDESGYQTDAQRTGEGCDVWDGRKNEYVRDSTASWRNPGFPQTDMHPVVCVSYNDALASIDWLNQRAGARYRLPTEAEWEYAARAGTETPFHTGACLGAEQANLDARTPYQDCPTGESVGRTVEVGGYAANAFKLHDMHGNVWEWTAECWHDSYTGAPDDGSAWLAGNDGDCSRRVVRGGSWNGEPGSARSANRGRFNPDGAVNNLGFRLARDL